MFLFTVYLAPFVVLLSCFVGMEDFVLITVYLFYIQAMYIAEFFTKNWRAVESDSTRTAGKLLGKAK